MPLAKNVQIDLEPLKTLEIPKLTLVLLSSSLDPLSKESSNTMHVQVSPRPFAILQNILLQKRGRGDSIITLERLRLSSLALPIRF
jgi:hypothetical protein